MSAKVGFFSTGLPDPTQGGSGLFNYQVCRWLLDRGVDVHGFFRVGEWFEKEQIDAEQVVALERAGLNVSIVREHPAHRRAYGLSLLEQSHQVTACSEAARAHRDVIRGLDGIVSLDLGWALALDGERAPAVAILGDPMRGRLSVRGQGSRVSRAELGRRIRHASLRRTTGGLARGLRGYDGIRRVLGSLSPSEAEQLTREGLPCRHFRWFTPDPQRAARQPVNDPLTLLHVGALATTASRSMFREWTRAVLPAMASLPFQIEIRLVGRGVLPDMSDVPSNVSIVLLGHVPDLEAEFSRAAAFLSPMRYPVGVRTRIVTALSYGMPVVADPSAASGLPELQDGVDVLWASGRGDYERVLRRLHDRPDLREEIGRSGRRAWERWFDPALNLPMLLEPLVSCGVVERTA